MEEKGVGWIAFAWMMLLIAGVMSIVNGIAALARKEVFEDIGAVYVAGDVQAWGWVVLILGVVEILAAISVWKGGEFGRWAGIIIAGLSMLIWFWWLPVWPWWGLIVITIDVLVIYALAVYGGMVKLSSD